MSIAASSIAQQAFRYMETSELASFGDDSDQARAAAEQFPQTRNAALARADWSFASELISLSEAQTAVADPDLPYAFVLPSRVLKLREVKADPRPRWRIDRRLLRADMAGPILIRATVQIDDETKLPAEFQNYVSRRLAAALSPRFASAANRARLLMEAAEADFEEALLADRAQASAERWDGRDPTYSDDWVGEVVR
ncbi:MAG: hypothetical protein AAF899_09690 [Pseudomonadota bacterium]